MKKIVLLLFLAQFCFGQSQIYELPRTSTLGDSISVLLLDIFNAASDSFKTRGITFENFRTIMQDSILAQNVFATYDALGDSAFAKTSELDGIISAHATVVLNAAHRTGDGSDHADVASNTTHRTSTGADHSYIDQDVTTGASPEFANINITDSTSTDKLHITDIASYDSDRDITDLYHLTDKRYVDEAVTALGARYYMLDDASGEADYKSCSTTVSTGGEQSVSGEDLANDDYVQGWIAPNVNEPDKLLLGVYNWRIYAAKTGGTKTLRLYWKLVERKNDDSEVVIATSVVSNEVVSGKNSYIIPLNLASDYDIASDSYVVGKIYADVSGGGSAPDITLYYEGSSHSHWQIPVNTEILDNLYVKKAGDTMTGTLNLPSDGLVAGTDQLVLAGDKVGVGKTDPDSTLDVDGSGHFSTNLKVGGQLNMDGNIDLGTNKLVGNGGNKGISIDADGSVYMPGDIYQNTIGSKWLVSDGNHIVQRANASNTLLRIAVGNGAPGSAAVGFYLTNDGANPTTSTASDFGMVSFGDQNQMKFFVADGAGNQIIITNLSNRSADHDHPVQANPTLYMHSDTNPDTNNSQWFSMCHDKLNAIFNIGTGAYVWQNGNFNLDYNNLYNISAGNINKFETNSIILQSTNLCNPLEIKEGGYYDLSGNWVVSASWFETGLVPVQPLTDYKRTPTPSVDKYTTFWKADSTFLSGISDDSLFTTPENAAFVRINFRYSNTNKNKVMITLADEWPNSYEQFSRGPVAVDDSATVDGSYNFDKRDKKYVNKDDSFVIINWGDSNTYSYSEAAEAPNVTYTGWESITANLNFLCGQFAGLSDAVIYKYGYSGYKAYQAKATWATLKTLNPDIITINFGTNDIRNGISADSFIVDLGALVDSIQNVSATPMIFGIPAISSVNEDSLKLWNTKLAKLAKDENIEFIDLYNLTKADTAKFFIESTNKRHFNHIATKRIARMIIDQLPQVGKDALSVYKADNLSNITYYATQTDSVYTYYYNSGYYHGDSLNTVTNVFRALKLKNSANDTLKFSCTGPFSICFAPIDTTTVEISYSTFTPNFYKNTTKDTIAISAFSNNRANGGQNSGWLNLRHGYGDAEKAYDVSIVPLYGVAYLRYISLNDVILDSLIFVE